MRAQVLDYADTSDVVHDSKWTEIKNAPDPIEDDDDDEEETLPHQEYLDRLAARTPHAAADVDAAGPCTTRAPPLDSNINVEGMNADQLNALIAVATAEKARRTGGA